MAYIEENMKLRRAREQQSADTDANTNTNPASTAAAGASARPNKRNAQDDVFDKLDPRYKVERKVGEEGSVTNSLSMLTAIPEVDLGMECVHVFTSPSSSKHRVLTAISRPSSTRLRNIEETEKAKLTLSHGRSRDNKVPDDEAHLAATRCAFSPHFSLRTFVNGNRVVPV